MKFLVCSLLALSLLACEKPERSAESETEYLELDWVDLVPPGYSSDDIVMKYQERLEEMEDDDPKAEAIYNQMMAELQNAPLNKELAKKDIGIPGFIAPLVQNKGLISEFLLVPYYGACIHVPPPPVNQTVLVKLAENHAIKADEAYLPIWVYGKISLDGKTTDIGEAGYRIDEAQIEPYVSE